MSYEAFVYRDVPACPDCGGHPIAAPPCLSCGGLVCAVCLAGEIGRDKLREYQMCVRCAVPRRQRERETATYAGHVAYVNSDEEEDHPCAKCTNRLPVCRVCMHCGQAAKYFCCGKDCWGLKPAVGDDVPEVICYSCMNAWDEVVLRYVKPTTVEKAREFIRREGERNLVVRNSSFEKNGEFAVRQKDIITQRCQDLKEPMRFDCAYLQGPFKEPMPALEYLDGSDVRRREFIKARRYCLKHPEYRALRIFCPDNEGDEDVVLNDNSCKSVDELLGELDDDLPSRPGQPDDADGDEGLRIHGHVIQFGRNPQDPPAAAPEGAASNVSGASSSEEDNPSTSTRRVRKRKNSLKKATENMEAMRLEEENRMVELMRDVEDYLQYARAAGDENDPTAEARDV